MQRPLDHVCSCSTRRVGPPHAPGYPVSILLRSTLLVAAALRLSRRSSCPASRP